MARSNQDETRRRILDGEPAEGLSSADRERMMEDDAEQELLHSAPLIAALDEAGRAQSRPTRHALERQWRAIRAAADFEAEEASGGVLARLRAALQWPARHGLATAGLALAAVAVIAVATIERPIATVAYVAGRLELTDHAIRRIGPGLSDARIVPGDRLEAIEGGVLVQVDGVGEVALAEGAAVQWSARDELSLSRGAIWIDARQAPAAVTSGDVRVYARRSAAFAFRSGDGGMSLEVARGQVEVTTAPGLKAVAIDAGQSARIDPASDEIAILAASGEPPAWVTLIRSAAEQAATGVFVPSVLSGDPPPVNP